MMRALILAAAIAVAGCTDDSPPHMAQVCDHWVTTLMMVPMFGANGTVRMNLIPQTHCAAWSQRCIVGRDYKGMEKSCPKEQGA